MLEEQIKILNDNGYNVTKKIRNNKVFYIAENKYFEYPIGYDCNPNENLWHYSVDQIKQII